MDFLLSGVAACGACVFTNPLEVVKTRMQLQGELRAPGTYTRHYRNVFHAFYTIGRVDGLAALQRGLLPALLYQFGFNGIRLGSYGIVKTHIQAQSAAEIAVGHQYQHEVFPKDSWLVALSAGMVSSFAVALTFSPFDVASTRLYSQPVGPDGQGLLYKGLLDCLAKIIRSEGFLGVYKGLGASYFRIGPHTILSLFFWDQLRQNYTHWAQKW
ncbi:hypothetical protein JD844_001097 [Phrynosoma platyrhinos]|uniref:Solute carrier family 25 member 35 n=1 Tax=Phrynosoma platyrhinos TaxID=52577 RepID=A0ABQ7T934_PHRPL|nr:hypothetical protein JD844_001097 [Phrynosoma platyrhinos]